MRVCVCVWHHVQLLIMFIGAFCGLLLQLRAICIYECVANYQCMIYVCVCMRERERERGVVVCMQMKSGSEASGNTGRIRTQFVAFHNFRVSLPKKSKCKKSLQFRFAHCSSHLLRMQRMFEWENNAGAAARGAGHKGAQRGVRGRRAMCWVRVVFAGFVCGVCLKFMTV